jgi:hypothetical protein
VIADVPRAQQRVQNLRSNGTLLTGFFLPGMPPRACVRQHDG